MNLKNKVALVTGGSLGIGRAVAESLQQAGARVAITGRNEAHLKEAASKLGVHGINADVSSEADVKRTYGEVLAKFGDLDILVNNAGIGVFKPLVEMETKSFDDVFATNVRGAMMMGREAAKIFVKRNAGNIINIASTAAVRGAPNGTAYYASKFALRGMTECWRAELRKNNIRVILINPSEVITSFAATAWVSPEGQPEQAPRRRHRLRGEGRSRNGGSRIYPGAHGLRNESRRLARTKSRQGASRQGSSLKRCVLGPWRENTSRAQIPISLNASIAVRKLSTPAGMPQ